MRSMTECPGLPAAPCCPREVNVTMPFDNIADIYEGHCNASPVPFSLWGTTKEVGNTQCFPACCSR
jgi:hypothetical protein